MVIIFKEDSSEVPSFLLHAEKNTLTDNESEGQIQRQRERELERREKEKERAAYRGISLQSALQLTPKS